MPAEIRHEAMGSPWEIDIGDEHVPPHLRDEMVAFLDSFDATYSRFKPDSLTAKLSRTSGRVTVPRDFVAMMQMYLKIYEATGGLMNPLIGQSLSDVGYDPSYSLTPQESIAQTPPLPEVFRIIDDETIELAQPVLIDIGSIGKGFAVDRLTELLQFHNLQSFMVNGSGDMRHVGAHGMVVGLEHPEDATSVIGTIELKNRSLASSGSNRRAWKQYHHILDPHTNTSPQYIRATWVMAESAAEADMLATALFFVDPETLVAQYGFEYLILNYEMRMKKSTGWDLQVFV